MKKNGYHFSYTNYEEMDAEGNLMGIEVSGPYKSQKEACIIIVGQDV